jgi:hypothetical protein
LKQAGYNFIKQRDGCTNKLLLLLLLRHAQALSWYSTAQQLKDKQTSRKPQAECSVTHTYCNNLLMLGLPY